MNLNKASQYLSLILRHEPSQNGVDMSHDGYCSTQQVISAINQAGFKGFSLDHLLIIVKNDKKQRYSIKECNNFIRANQGHSIPVDLGLTPVQPLDVLYHGTSPKFLELILNSELKPMNREFLHLSCDLKTAKMVGKRHAKSQPVQIIHIDAKRLYEEGHQFYLSDNNVWLSREPISPKYFIKIQSLEKNF